MNPENKKSSQKKLYTSLYKFPDGRIAEMICSKENGSQFVYLDLNGSIVYANKIETETSIILPFPENQVSSNAVLFPSEATDYMTAGVLIEEIMSFIHKYLDIEPIYEKICAYFVLFTYFFDRFDVTPYLRFTGDYGCGKSRAWKTIGSLCYKTIFCSGATTSSPIFRFIDLFHSVLAIDESDLKSSTMNDEIIKILNSGYMAGSGVMRSDVSGSDKQIIPRIFDCYCPKIIITRESFKDRALESRCLTITMTGRQRKDIPLNIKNDEFNKEALGLRNKLLLFRLRNYSLTSLKESLFEEAIEDRLNQIIIPLLSVVSNPDDSQEIIAFMKETNKKMLEDRSATLEYDVLEAINALLKANPEVKLSGITEEVNKANPAETDQLTPRKIGYILREKLKLRTKRKGNGTYLIISEEQLIKLNKRFAYVGNNQ